MQARRWVPVAVLVAAPTLQSAQMVSMNLNESWVALVVGVLLVVFGLTITGVSGAMPGAKPLYPPPLRFRLILIAFGVVMVLVGAIRLIRT
jgi:hypothetical protein